jgi:hypothetical protein
MRGYQRAIAPVLLALLAVPLLAQTPKPGGLEYLQGFVGKYPSEVKLWETEPLNARLKALLGAQHATLLVNTQTVGPLARYADVVWTSGNKAHEGGVEAALFLADTKANVVEVYLLSKGKLSHFAEKGAAIPVEGAAKTILASFKEAAR